MDAKTPLAIVICMIGYVSEISFRIRRGSEQAVFGSQIAYR